MTPIEFERVVVARTAKDELLIALFDGSAKGAPTECVVLLTCSDDAARALLKAVSSAVKSSKT